MSDSSVWMIIIIAALVIFLVSAVSAFGVAFLATGIYVAMSNNANKVDFYETYISRSNIQLLKAHELRRGP